jgi:hypothetical protein
MNLSRLLLLLVALALLLAGCVTRNLVVALDIPGDYPVKQKLALAQGISQDIALPSFNADIREKFPSVSDKYLGGFKVSIKQFLMSNDKKRDVALELRMEYKGSDLEAIKPMFEYIKTKIGGEINYRIKHLGIELLLAQDNPVGGYIKKEYNNPSQSVYVADNPLMTNADIKEAVLLNDNGHIGVEIILNASGVSKIKEATTNNIGKRMAMMVNGQVICAPRIREPISDTQLQIAGSFTEAQAKQLVDIINSGRITSGGSSHAAAP